MVVSVTCPKCERVWTGHFSDDKPTPKTATCKDCIQEAIDAKIAESAG